MPSIEYKILNSKNSQYDEEHLEKMNLLYQGGYQIMKQANLFLKKIAIESPQTFKERLKCAAYLPYLSQFIDYFSSFLFSDELLVKEASDSDDPNTLGEPIQDQDFYKLFAANCDNQSNSFHNFMKDSFTEALYLPCSIIGVELPKSEVEPTNLLEEEQSGLNRAYLYRIDPKTLIDWKQLPNYKFQWVKLKYDIPVQDDPLKPPQHKIAFKIWTLNEAGFAKWELYESSNLPLNKEPKNNDKLSLIDSGDTSFTEIPIFDLSICQGLHIGDKLGPICEEIFQRRSFLVSNMNKSCVAVAVLKLGPEITAPGFSLPSEVQQDPNRGSYVKAQAMNQGMTILGKDDDFSIAETKGESHKLVNQQIDELIEKMHQLVNQMSQTVQNNSKQAKSAASKQEDRHSTQIILSAYSRQVKDFVREIYNCIAAARKEEVIWEVDGLNEFVDEDRADIIAEATLTSQIAKSIPSLTFQKAYLKRQAHALLGDSNNEAQELQIEEEIDQNVTELEESEENESMEQETSETNSETESEESVT